MDGTGVILFVVVIVSVIALIAVANRRSSLEEEERVAEPEPLSSRSTAPRYEAPASREEKAPVRSSGPAQITMYAYTQPNRMRRCRCCDAENAVNAGFCKVCGMKLG